MAAPCLLFDNSDNTVRLDQYEVPALQDGEVLIKTEYTCISPGTELRCLRGKQARTPDIPYIPGYAAVGRVIDANGSALANGTLVYCSGASRTGDAVGKSWGGHCGQFVLAADDAFPIPENVDPVEASLTSLGAIAHHGFSRSKPRSGENVLHVGLGVLGQLSARVHQTAGATILGCDLSPKRVALSVNSGVPAVVAEGKLRDLAEANLPARPTLVVDTTGVVPVISQAIDAMADLPWDNEKQPDYRYLIQGSFEDEFSIPYQPAFLRQLKFLLTRDRQAADAQAFIALLAEKKVNVRDLVHDVISPDQCEEAYEQLKDPEKVLGTIVFKWK